MHFKRARFIIALMALLCMLAVSIACGSSVDDEEDIVDADGGAETANLTPYQPTGNEGTITGVVNFDGTAPAPRAIPMESDPICAQIGTGTMTEDLVVSDGKLQNVFVYIKEGRAGDKNINSYSFPATQPKQLDQKGCRYVPHVIGVQTKQTLEITNSDATSHNVNVDARVNSKFNQGQPNGAPAIVKEFQRPETIIPVKCNQHPWMRAYIGVLSHPFFSVSGQDGRFEIKGVPPGTYTLIAWHEKYPQGITQSVTVGPGESKQTDFQFSSQQMASDLQGQKSALTVLPALELPLIGHH